MNIIMRLEYYYLSHEAKYYQKSKRYYHIIPMPVPQVVIIHQIEQDFETETFFLRNIFEVLLGLVYFSIQ